MLEEVSSAERYCEHCRLLRIACICQYRPTITSAIEFCLLTHETEYRKPTNTGRLIADCVKSTRVYTWSRTEIEPGLQQELADPNYRHWLVYPSEDAEHKGRISPDKPITKRYTREKQKQDVFILLDATWQQAGKMFRKSPYLNNLPILSLSPEQLSQYQLRRGAQAHHLCTAEVAIDLLNRVGEQKNASLLQDYFLVFSQHYMAARSGHAVKQESEQMRRLLKEYHNEVN